MSLTKDAILTSADRPVVKVMTPEWGDGPAAERYVFVRTLSGIERDAFEAEGARVKSKDPAVRLRNFRARLVAYCAVDDAGSRLFTDEDAEALGAKSAKALGRVFDAAAKHNGLSADDIEELAKN